MSLSSTTVKVSYAGDDSTVSFPITFVFWDDTDIKAILRAADGTETVWVLSTQYTLTGGGGATGTLTVDTSPTDYTPATGETLVIKSARASTQPTAFPLGGAFPSTSAERALDQAVRLSQQNNEEHGRFIRFTETSAISDTTISDSVATFLATPSSTNLAAAVTGETGTGSLVFAISPTLVTPALGTPASGVATNLTGTAAGLSIGGNAATATTATTATAISVSNGVGASAVYPMWTVGAGNYPGYITPAKMSFVPDTGILTAVGFVGDVEGNATGIANKIAFSVKVGSNQTIPNNSDTKLLLDTEDYDVGGCFASSRFTPTIEDVYTITLNVNLASIAENSNFKIATIKKNGVAVLTAYSLTPTQAWEANITKDIYLNGTTDYVEFYVWQNTGVAGYALTSSNRNCATGHRTYAY